MNVYLYHLLSLFCSSLRGQSDKMREGCLPECWLFMTESKASYEVMETWGFVTQLNLQC